MRSDFLKEIVRLDQIIKFDPCLTIRCSAMKKKKWILDFIDQEMSERTEYNGTERSMKPTLSQLEGV